MQKKSETGKIIRRTAASLRPTSKRELARMEAAAAGPIDTSDIPELFVSSKPVRRNALGELPVRPSMTRDAIVSEMKSRNLTVYRLWKEAQRYCPQLPQSAVSEFLKGQRQLGLTYAEALLSALSISLTIGPKKRKPQPAKSADAPARKRARA